MHIDLIGLNQGDQDMFAQVTSNINLGRDEYDDMPIDPYQAPYPDVDSFFMDQIAQGNNSFDAMTNDLAASDYFLMGDEWTVQNENVVTDGFTFYGTQNGDNLRLDVSRATDQNSTNQTWTYQYTHNGQPAGTNVLTVSGTGVDSWFVTPSGDVQHQFHYPAETIFFN